MPTITEFPITTVALSSKSVATTLADAEHFIVSTATGIQRITRADTGVARTHVGSTAPTWAPRSYDIWVDTSTSPAPSVFKMYISGSWTQIDFATSAQPQDAYLDDISALTLVQGDLLYFNGTDITRLGAGTSGQFLKTQGAGANPIWANYTKGFKSLQSIGVNTALTQYGYDSVEFTASGVTATLWASPTKGDAVTIINYSGADCYIDGNGALIRSGSTTTDAIATISNNEVFSLIYNGTDWLLTT